MLGKTHEVTAPTGLLKVMESAVAGEESARDSTSLSMLGVAGLNMHPQSLCRRGGSAGCSAPAGCLCPAKGTLQPHP
jgi:hypothetical protein